MFKKIITFDLIKIGRLKLINYSFSFQFFLIFLDLTYKAFIQALISISHNYLFIYFLILNYYINRRNNIGAEGVIGLGTGLQQLTQL